MHSLIRKLNNNAALTVPQEVYLDAPYHNGLEGRSGTIFQLFKNNLAY